ncbi:hypothetical protein GCM10023339_40210 [Alloalcanivorax gelatiniphagus]
MNKLDIAPSTVSGTHPTTRFCVLGHVKIERGDRAMATGDPQLQLVLALLLAKAGQVVRTEELIRGVWDEDAPPDACVVLNSLVTEIRRLFEPRSSWRSDGFHLHCHPDGYQVLLPEDDLDLLRFRRLVREALVAADAQTSLDRYLEALQLWHGPATALSVSGADCPILAALEAEKVAVLCEAAACALRAGQAAVMTPFLREASQQHPLDERLHTQYLLCLAASGRNSDAVRKWDQLHRRLCDNSGMQPGREFRALRGKLASTPAVHCASPHPVAARESEAPRDPGKTGVAIRLALTHPEGRLHVALRGTSPIADPSRTLQVLTQFFESWGLPATDVPVEVLSSPKGHYREVLVQHRAVVAVSG